MRRSEEETQHQMIAAKDAWGEQEGWGKRAAKRGVDIVGALLFFTLFSGIFILIWWTVLATTGGPATYKHRRVGRDGREFDCLKFRSMVTNSAEVLRDLLENDPQAREEWTTTFKLRRDPRITRFGAFIRKTSLDELPQFWNVLRGDMSIVGPRPVVQLELDTYYGPYAQAYCKMRPGITGPWQVNGRSNTTYAERVAMDASYVRNWTLLGDLSLIARTVGAVFSGRGSY
ncbi:sugar transferase [Xylophilus rhododendri]|uniref:Sugar transferase n=1 Tax=Xylophilus rhododendri TaxID=2697032 RepID=A0A857JAI4_9BURK|nr:sugar transferase [Xylophilus rhododendri]QHJ00152.1 sugar transferase [Xylophilus rhododendri]